MSQIGLMDCNNFFVSCERLFRPDLVHKPVAVLSSNDGCIVARSQEVKDIGIPMGAPYFKVKDLCETHNVTLFSGNLTLYRDISTRVMQTLAKEVGECEIYSIDEAFFTLSESVTVDEIQSIRQLIWQHIGIPVSIGVSTTKTLAKIGGEMEKKGSGVGILTSEIWSNKASSFSCGEIWNVGRRMSARLSEVGVRTAADLMALERSYLKSEFGVAGTRVWDELHGTRAHQVSVNSQDIRKSMTSSRSFKEATYDVGELESAVAYHLSAVMEKLRARGLVTTRVYIAMQASRFGDFAYRKGSTEVHLSEPTNDTQVVLKEVIAAVRAMYDKEVPYKKAGITLGGILPEQCKTVSLFSEPQPVSGSSLDSITDSINRRFGRGTLRSGVIRHSGARASARLRSAAYTTNWSTIPQVRAI